MMDLSHVANGDRPHGGPGLLASPGIVLPRHPTTPPSTNLLPNRFYYTQCFKCVVPYVVVHTGSIFRILSVQNNSLGMKE